MGHFGKQAVSKNQKLGLGVFKVVAAQGPASSCASTMRTAKGIGRHRTGSRVIPHHPAMLILGALGFQNSLSGLSFPVDGETQHVRS
jgi:hypothetical protein